MNLGMKNVKWLSAIALPVVFGAVSAVKLFFDSPGWGDEIYTADTAVNLALHGEWISHNWPYSYHPLHLWLLTPWLKTSGVSHFSVCLFDVLWAVAACVAANVILLRRQILRDLCSVLLFDMMFWGGANMLWTILSGRIDMLVLFWTVLTVDALLAPAVDERRHLVKLGLYALALSLSGIYTIPLIGVIWLMTLACPCEDRQRMLKRGLVCGCAGFAAFVTVCGYFLWHRALFRYLYTTICHCSTISGQRIGSAAGWRECYFVEPMALTGYIVALAVCWKWARRETNWRLFLFVGAIPGLMVFFGRYAYYYHWLFYLPVAVGLVWAWQKVPSVYGRMGVLVAGILYFGWNEAVWFNGHVERPYLECQRAFSDFLNKNRSRMQPGDDLVLTSTTYYYPTVGRGFRPWIREPEFRGQFLRTTETQIEKALDMRIGNPGLREKVRWLITRMEKITSPRFPKSGYLLAHNEDAARALGEVLAWLEYKVLEVDRQGPFILMRFDRQIVTQEVSDAVH